MNADNRRYVNRLSHGLSKVKLLIMITLLEAGNQYPRDWVESSKLLYLSNSKYFHSNVKELRDEMGCDIESKEIAGEVCYRIRSHDLIKAEPKSKARDALENSQKDALLLYAGHACQVCGVKMIAGEIELRPDLKIPPLRGGSEEFDNWQVICNTCNVAKRHACMHCTEQCDRCLWSFPERLKNVTLLRLPTELSKKLDEIGITNKEKREKYIISLLEESFNAEQTNKNG